jgi:thioredoxin-like negative regulator of GroEL
MPYSIALVFISFYVAFSFAGPTKDSNGIITLTNKNWDEVVKSPGHDVVVEFYSPSCIYCVQFEPIWNEIGRYFLNEDSIYLTKIDASKPDGMIPGVEISGVPTIIIYPANRKDNPILYYSYRTTSRVVEWILENVDLPVDVEITYKSQPLPSSNEGPVTEVVGLNWKSVVLNPDKDVFVNFYAPWCPYSNMLKPTWKVLGERLKDVPSVVIAQFDGTANEVPGLRLEAFPTMTLYRAGDNEAKSYDIRSPRTEEALLQFLQAEAVLPFLDPVTGKMSHDVVPVLKDHAIDVPELDDANYENLIQQSQKNVVVLYYAPWCEHSQELFKTWEDIYLDFSNIHSVQIFQMDATKHKIAKVDIYPTIKIFPATIAEKKDLEGITFKGKTSEENIKEFIQTNAVRTDVEIKIQEAHREAEKRGLPPPTEEELEAQYGIDFPSIDYSIGQSLVYKAKEDL